MQLIQTEKTQAMNLSPEEEAQIILNDLFDGDEDTKTKALSQIGLIEQDEIFNYILEHEDRLYDLYLPVRGGSISEG